MDRGGDSPLICRSPMVTGTADTSRRRTGESMRRPADAGSGPKPSGWRVLTDITGPFDTVVLEVETDSLAEWEQAMPQMFASPEFQADIARSAEMTVSGHRALYTIEARG